MFYRVIYVTCFKQTFFEVIAHLDTKNILNFFIKIIFKIAEIQRYTIITMIKLLLLLTFCYLATGAPWFAWGPGPEDYDGELLSLRAGKAIIIFLFISSK